VKVLGEAPGLPEPRTGVPGIGNYFLKHRKGSFQLGQACPEVDVEHLTAQNERSAPGLTAKVLNERLSKMLRFGILERVVYPEVPPRVEYRLTDFGWRFAGILDVIEDLQRSREEE